jgi:hypothetical protein
MACCRRKSATARTTAHTAALAGPRRPPALWREAGRRVVLGLAGSTGAGLVATLEWWLRTH